MERSAPALPPLSEVIARHGLTPRKSFSQNYLLDPRITARIARAAAPLAGATVIEVGPGPGGLTRALLAEGAKVIAVERDPRFLPALDELAAAYPGRLAVHIADAVGCDLARLTPSRCTIVANLPYQVATVLLLDWLRRSGAIDRMVLMFQKEVAARLVATPSTKAYGRLAVQAQWQCRVEALFDLAPGAFTPPPKVASTVVRLTPRPAPIAPADPAALERVLAAAFGQRRKMLRGALKTLGGDVETLLATAGVVPTARAEELSVVAFCALARAYAASQPPPV
ncbi:MAG: 16S rRNA (adenine(1518)-N(6)/adenine(1519)-N(6))-dimethyltransferase RsmA [Alphaproteobacteria bacterium]|nr:16S rRNA (adenine(1518)-N(6)/adenine(1519)-N(6))-dimethyltransferase RsmA [Alphaproteobacteria bacterium]